jgi:hypothetical protein
MKLERSPGVTSEIWQIFIQDSTSTTGAGLTGLTNGSAGLTGYYHRDTDTTATAISIVSMTVGTFTSGGFKEIDATNMPGWYQFCPPNAALAAGAKSCGFHLKGATNMAPLPIEVDLAGQVDVTRWNGTAVTTPNTAGTPVVDVGRINNVSTSSVSAVGAFIGNATAALAVDASGRIDVGKTLGNAVTLDSNNVLNVSTKYVGGTLQTARDLGNALPAAAPGAANGLMITGTNTGPWVVTGGVNFTNSGGDAFKCNSTGGAGHGIRADGNTTGDGIHATGGTNAAGIHGTGQGSQYGIYGEALGTGAGIYGLGGVTSGPGARFEAQGGNSDGLLLLSFGSGKDLKAGSTSLVLAKTTNITGFNDVTAAAVATAVFTDTTGSDFATLGSPGKILVTQLGGAFTDQTGSVFSVPALANAPTGGSAPTVAQIATGLWQDLLAGADFGTAGSIGALLKAFVDVAISSRSAYAGLTVAEAAAIADKILTRNTGGGSDAGFTLNARSVSNAIRSLGNKVAFDVPAPGQYTIFDETDGNAIRTGTYTVAAVNPVTVLDPA